MRKTILTLILLLTSNVYGMGEDCSDEYKLSYLRKTFAHRAIITTLSKDQRGDLDHVKLTNVLANAELLLRDAKAGKCPKLSNADMQLVKDTTWLVNAIRANTPIRP